MNLLIVGSRSIKEFDLSEHIPITPDLIISGGADGIDTIAEKYADDHRISKLILRPKYNIYGKYAPLKRNEKMVDLADEILIIWDGKSKGTKRTEQYALKSNKPVKTILYKKERL